MNCTNVSPLAMHTTDPFRVRYEETDQMGYAYYGRYLVWLEIGRTDFLRNLGSSYKDWEEIHGVYLPVRECRIKYKVPAKYDDLLTVETRMIRLSRASVDFEYVVRRTGSPAIILATASTTHAFINRSGQICRVADKLLPHFFVLPPAKSA